MAPTTGRGSQEGGRGFFLRDLFTVHTEKYAKGYCTAKAKYERAK
jgi:hypothetical protein